MKSPPVWTCMKLLRKLLVEHGWKGNLWAWHIFSSSYHFGALLQTCDSPSSPQQCLRGLRLRNTSPYSSLSDESGAKSGSSDHLWYSPAWREQLAFGCSTEHCFMLQSFSKLFWCFLYPLKLLYPFIFMIFYAYCFNLFYTPTGSSRQGLVELSMTWMDQQWALRPCEVNGWLRRPWGIAAMKSLFGTPTS